MNDPAHYWYVRGEGNKPAGPFTTEELLDSLRAGRLDAKTICWCEGMSHWLPLCQTEPFASAIASVSLSPPITGGTKSLAAGRIAPASATALSGLGGRRCAASAWIGWAIAGGVAAISAIVVSVFMMCSGKPPSTTAGKDPASHAAGKPSVGGDEASGAAVLAGIIHDYAERLEAAYQSRSTEIQRAAAVAAAVEEFKARVRNCGLVTFSGKVVEIIREPAMLGGQTRDRWGISMDLPQELEPLARSGACTFGSKVWVDLERSKALSIHKGDPISVRGAVTYMPGSLLLSGDHCVVMQVWPNSKESVTNGFGFGKLGTPQTVALPISDSVVCSVGPFNTLGVCHFLGGPARQSGGPPSPSRSNRAGELPSDGPIVGLRPMKSPQEQKEEKDRYEKIIAEAGQAAAKGQGRDAVRALDEARLQFRNLYENDGRVQKILNDARFALAFDSAKKSFADGDLEAALTAVDGALRIRFGDKDAKALHDKICGLQVEKLKAQSRTASNAGDFEEAVRLIQQAARLLPDDAGLQTLLDSASMEFHRGKAEKEIAAENLPAACTEVLAAREILEKQPKDQSAGLRKALDVLAETLVAESREKAKTLASRRQYDEARGATRLGLRLSSKDQSLSDLLTEIEKLEADPHTANISGAWKLPNGARCELTDNGTEIIGYRAVKLPPGMLSCAGEWTRKGDKLVGQFHVVYAQAPQERTVGTVRATITDANTLAVFWQDTTKPKRLRDGTWTWEGKGEGSWTKVEFEP